jgi:hypothetical protein
MLFQKSLLRNVGSVGAVSTSDRQMIKSPVTIAPASMATPVAASE